MFLTIWATFVPYRTMLPDPSLSCIFLSPNLRTYMFDLHYQTQLLWIHSKIMLTTFKMRREYFTNHQKTIYSTTFHVSTKWTVRMVQWLQSTWSGVAVSRLLQSSIGETWRFDWKTENPNCFCNIGGLGTVRHRDTMITWDLETKRSQWRCGCYFHLFPCGCTMCAPRSKRLIQIEPSTFDEKRFHLTNPTSPAAEICFWPSCAPLKVVRCCEISCTCFLSFPEIHIWLHLPRNWEVHHLRLPRNVS